VVTIWRRKSARPSPPVLGEGGPLSAIPKLIHQTWRSPHVPERWRAAVRSWKAHHPAWAYRLWTDADARALVAAPAVAALEVRCLPLCDTWLPSCPGMRSDGKGGVHGTRSRAPYGPQGPPRAHPRELANGVARRAAGACRSAAAPARRPRDHARAGRSRVRSPARGLPRARVPGRRLLPAGAGRRGRGRRGARRLLRAPAVLSHRASAYTVSSRRLARAPG
jgi:hypothetical protein